MASLSELMQAATMMQERQATRNRGTTPAMALGQTMSAGLAQFLPGMKTGTELVAKRAKDVREKEESRIKTAEEARKKRMADEADEVMKSLDNTGNKMNYYTTGGNGEKPDNSPLSKMAKMLDAGGEAIVIPGEKVTYKFTKSSKVDKADQSALDLKRQADLQMQIDVNAGNFAKAYYKEVLIRDPKYGFDMDNEELNNTVKAYQPSTSEIDSWRAVARAQASGNVKEFDRLWNAKKAELNVKLEELDIKNQAYEDYVSETKIANQENRFFGRKHIIGREEWIAQQDWTEENKPKEATKPKGRYTILKK